jgi:hypothetical protein
MTGGFYAANYYALIKAIPIYNYLISFNPISSNSKFQSINVQHFQLQIHYSFIFINILDNRTSNNSNSNDRNNGNYKCKVFFTSS